MPKFNDDMIGRLWRQRMAVGTLTVGSYLMAVSSCLAFYAFQRGKVADVLTVSGFLRTALFAVALKGGFELLRAAPATHQRYFDSWLPDKVTMLSRPSFDAELKQEQASYKVFTSAAFLTLAVLQQYYLPQLLSGKEHVAHVSTAAMATLVTCCAAVKKQREMLSAVTEVKEVGFTNRP
ncbi:MAG: hypothetical protein P1U63_04920 [Coxiellaceae bacterium]|nr:hypothetical protein [Coxiellaceae bacterium]